MPPTPADLSPTDLARALAARRWEGKSPEERRRETAPGREAMRLIREARRAATGSDTVAAEAVP